MPDYRYYTAGLVSDQLLLELPFTGVTWSRKIRRGGEFSGSCGVLQDDPDIDLFFGTMPGLTALYVTRDGEPVWGGVITDREYSARDKTVEVGAVTFEAWLYRRVIWHAVEYDNNVDQYQVVRNLIHLMQGDFDTVNTSADGVESWPSAASVGLTVDDTISGKSQDTLTVSGSELRSFGDVIEEFSNNMGGFEYYVDFAYDAARQKFVRKLVFRDTPPGQMPKGDPFTGVRTGLDNNIFEFPGNIIDLGLKESIEDASTRYFVTGKEEQVGDVALPTPRGAWANARYLAAEWPLIDVVDSSRHSEARRQTTLDKWANRYGRQTKPPISTWTITVNGSLDPQVDAYSPGDWCRIIADDPFLVQRLELSQEATTGLVKRIWDYTVSVGDSNPSPEVVQITLADEWTEESA